MVYPRVGAWTGSDRKGHYGVLVNSTPLNKAKVGDTKPIISVKEARKLLGVSAKDMTNEELKELIIQQEQIIRFVFRKLSVHKQSMVN